MSLVLVDAGPLVALIDRSDTYHLRCRKALESLRDPLATVWPAFTEAMHLLRSSAEAQRAPWTSIEAGAVRLLPLSESDAPRMRELIWKYTDLQMDLADAALVRVAEREKLRRVFTTDRKDFALYRPLGLSHFQIIP